MNNNNKIFRYNKTRDALRMRERDKSSKSILQKTKNKIKKKMIKKLKRVTEKAKNTIEENI